MDSLPFAYVGGLSLDEQRSAVHRVVATLAAHRGIAVAPVTIDNNDYEYNQRLVDAKREGRMLDLRDSYLDHMTGAAMYCAIMSPWRAAHVAR